jgi:2Fe-2S ferredoxin
MPSIVFLQPSGETRRVEARAGDSAMRAAVGAGIAGIEAACGGVCSCATCHVYVAAQWLPALPPPAGEEEALLDFVDAPRTAASRLACQIEMTAALDGLVLTVPG